MREISYAVIGTSWITEEFIKAADLAGGMKLKAVYSRDKTKGEAFAKRNGAERTVSSLDELSRTSDIEAVYIASPNSLHYEQSRLMLENGKHVICEKPAATCPGEIEKLCCLAKSRSLVYMEAIMFLHLPELAKLKQAMTKIGKITSGNLDFSQLSSKYAALKGGSLPNIFNPEFHTGCLMDIGVYNIYTALELFGTPDNVISSAGFLSSGADCTGTAILVYPDKHLTLTYSKIGQSHSPSQIFSDEGTILIDSISQLQNIRIIYSDMHEETVCGERDRTEIMSHEAARFRDFINGKYEAELLYAQSLSLDVSRIMELIRTQNAEFKF